jgi:hypothetical protein
VTDCWIVNLVDAVLEVRREPTPEATAPAVVRVSDLLPL